MYIAIGFVGGLLLGIVLSCLAINARVDRITAEKIGELTINDIEQIMLKVDEKLQQS